MSYPQVSSNKAVLNGLNNLRLFTPLVSPGDIYEVDVSGNAFVVGPNSDIANARVTYFDPTVDFSAANSADLSPGAGFAGFVVAHGSDALYLPANRPGRILLAPTDIFDPTYLPTGFVPASDIIHFESPNIDIIQYFAPNVAQLGTLRNDKATLWEFIPNKGAVGVGRDTYVMIPYYGRRLGFVAFANDNVGNVDIQIDGINFAIVNDAIAGGIPHHNVTPILASTPVPTATQTAKQISATTNGMFDYLQIRLRPGGLFAANLTVALRVRVSDRAS